MQHEVGAMAGVTFLLAVAGRLAAAVEAAGELAGTQVAQRRDLTQDAVALPLERLDVQ